MVFKLSRERSKKTEAVFLVGSRESEGKSKSPQALFLLPAFSFGEAKENADGQLQICTVYQPFERLLETPGASPMRGSCRRRRLMRWTTLRRSKCPHLIRHGFSVPPSPRRGRHWGCSFPPRRFPQQVFCGDAVELCEGEEVGGRGVGGARFP